MRQNKSTNHGGMCLKTRVVSLVLSFAMMLGMMPVDVFAASDGLTIQENELTKVVLYIEDGDISIFVDESDCVVFTQGETTANCESIVLSNRDSSVASTNTVSVTTKATNRIDVELESLNIDVSEDSGAAFSVWGDGEVAIELSGKNYLFSASGRAGLEIDTASTVIIDDVDGDASEGVGGLQANGGASAAGIGSKNDKNNGTIIINGGRVVGNGGFNSAGIGGGDGGGAGLIIINGGSVAGGCNWYGAGIGCGGYYDDENGGRIIINGGKVTTSSNVHGAGIGGALDGFVDEIIITGGAITAAGKGWGAGIGDGYNKTGSIVILGGSLSVSGGDYDVGAKAGAINVNSITGRNEDGSFTMEEHIHTFDSIIDDDPASCDSPRVITFICLDEECPHGGDVIEYPVGITEEHIFVRDPARDVVATPNTNGIEAYSCVNCNATNDKEVEYISTTPTITGLESSYTITEGEDLTLSFTVNAGGEDGLLDVVVIREPIEDFEDCWYYYRQGDINATSWNVNATIPDLAVGTQKLYVCASASNFTSDPYMGEKEIAVIEVIVNPKEVVNTVAGNTYVQSTMIGYGPGIAPEDVLSEGVNPPSLEFASEFKGIFNVVNSEEVYKASFSYTIAGNIITIVPDTTGAYPEPSFSGKTALYMEIQEDGSLKVYDYAPINGVSLGFTDKGDIFSLKTNEDTLPTVENFTLNGVSDNVTIEVGEALTLGGVVKGNGNNLAAVSVAIRLKEDPIRGGEWHTGKDVDGNAINQNIESFDLTNFNDTVVIAGQPFGNMEALGPGDYTVQVYVTNQDGKGFETAHQINMTIVAKQEDGKFLLGDVNWDGMVDRKDRILLNKYLSGQNIEINLGAADINKDGLVDKTDYTILSRHLADWIGYEDLENIRASLDDTSAQPFVRVFTEDGTDLNGKNLEFDYTAFGLGTTFYVETNVDTSLWSEFETVFKAKQINFEYTQEGYSRLTYVLSGRENPFNTARNCEFRVYQRLEADNYKLTSNSPMFAKFSVSQKGNPNITVNEEEYSPIDNVTRPENTPTYELVAESYYYYDWGNDKWLFYPSNNKYGRTKIAIRNNKTGENIVASKYENYEVIMRELDENPLGVTYLSYDKAESYLWAYGGAEGKRYCIELIDTTSNTTIDSISVFVYDCVRDDLESVFGKRSFSALPINAVHKFSEEGRPFAIDQEAKVIVSDAKYEFKNDKIATYPAGYYKVTFDVYNQTPYIFGVSAFNADCAPVSGGKMHFIDSYSETYSAWYRVAGTGKIIFDIIRDGLFESEKHNISKRTQIQLEVPVGGYIQFFECSDDDLVKSANIVGCLLEAINLVENVSDMVTKDGKKAVAVDKNKFLDLLIEYLEPKDILDILRNMTEAYAKSGISGMKSFWQASSKKDAILSAMREALLSSDNLEEVGMTMADSIEDTVLSFPAFLPAYFVTNGLDAMESMENIAYVVNKLTTTNSKENIFLKAWLLPVSNDKKGPIFPVK